MSDIRVVIADDQQLVRTGFALILGSEPGLEVVAEAADGATAVAEVERLRPDVVVMDIRMPGVDGLEATRIIADKHPDTRVLVVTTFDLDEYVDTALRNGASGFLLKDAPPEELVHAVKVVHEGAALLAPRVTRRLIEHYLTEPAPAEPPEAIADLTDREMDVLLCLARGRSNAEIAEELFVSETTVKSHLGRILMKLGLRDRVQAVVFAYEHGLVTVGEQHD